MLINKCCYLIRSLSKEETPANQDQLKRQVESAREQLAGAQKILGEKNMIVLKLRRQLDAVPGNAELNQYQRRFTELCSQGYSSFSLSCC